MKSSKWLIRPFQVALKKSKLARNVRAVATGRASALDVELSDFDLDPGPVFLGVTRSLPVGSPELARLVDALRSSGTVGLMLDGLTDDAFRHRQRCARLAGALRLDSAVPWLGM